MFASYHSKGAKSYGTNEQVNPKEVVNGNSVLSLLSRAATLPTWVQTMGSLRMANPLHIHSGGELFDICVHLRASIWEKHMASVPNRMPVLEG